jgi:hypothetical protein
MRMNVLRLKVVHDALISLWHTITFSKKSSNGSSIHGAQDPKKWTLLRFLRPSTLDEFEKDTEWTHILSARCIMVRPSFAFKLLQKASYMKDA